MMSFKKLGYALMTIDTLTVAGLGLIAYWLF